MCLGGQWADVDMDTGDGGTAKSRERSWFVVKGSRSLDVWSHAAFNKAVLANTL